MKRFHKVVVATLASGVALFFAAEQTRADDSLLTIGSDAPPIDVEHWVSQGNGKFEKVTKFEEGKVYVIEFWATWCGPCVASMPHLAELQQRFGAKGVQLVSISDEELDVVHGFLERPVQNGKSNSSENDSENGEASKKDGDEEEETYGKLTSAYCLTTDPDRSVHTEYMEAAGQNGIPTAFIVGKDGKVEWIGHPMQMDSPLEQIVAGKWDREAAKAEIYPTQQKGLLTTKIGKAMRSGDSDAALAIIDEALQQNADDSELGEFLSRVRIQVQIFPITQLARQGKHKEALEALEELKAKVPEQKSTFLEFQLSILLNGEMHDEAAEVLNQIASGEENPVKLNQISWMIYEAAQNADGFSEKLLASAVSAAKKAAKLAPEEGAVLDTYAHLLHRSGNLDEALTVQTKASELVGDSNPDVKAFLEQLTKEKAEADKAK